MDPLHHLIVASEEDRAARLACPLDLQVECIPAMLNCELADHPLYDGVELQRWDDPEHGTGMLAFLSRRADGLVDFYLEPGLRIDRTQMVIGAGIGEWRHTPFDVARLEVAPDGVDAHVRFTDAEGRRIEVRVDDRDGRLRRRASLLAPVGAAIEHPRSLLLVWMREFDLVRTSAAAARVSIDGVPVATGALPAGRVHRRLLIKYAADLAVTTVNAQRDEPAATGEPQRTSRVEVSHDGGGTAALSARDGERGAGLRLDPPLPDPRAIPAGQRLTGTWTVTVDDALITGGTWTATGGDDDVLLGLDVTRRWKPTRLPLFMRAVTTAIPTFRTWPTSYRWRAVVARSRPAVSHGGWERTEGSERGEAYRRATRSRTR